MEQHGPHQKTTTQKTNKMEQHGPHQKTQHRKLIRWSNTDPTKKHNTVYDCLEILNCTTYSSFTVVLYRPNLLFDEAGIPGENHIFDRLQEQTKHTWK